MKMCWTLGSGDLETFVIHDMGNIQICALDIFVREVHNNNI